MPKKHFKGEIGTSMFLLHKKKKTKTEIDQEKKQRKEAIHNIKN